MPKNWFKLEEYPYFSKLKKELIEALPSKGVEAEMARKKDVEYIVVLLAAMARCLIFKLASRTWQRWFRSQRTKPWTKLRLRY